MNRQGWLWTLTCLVGLLLLGCGRARARVPHVALMQDAASGPVADDRQPANLSADHLGDLPETPPPVIQTPALDEPPIRLVAHAPTRPGGPVLRIVQPSDTENSVEKLPQPSREEDESSHDLTLRAVIESVHQTYPLLDVAQRERIINEGKLLAAWGEFDIGLDAYAIEQPLGFYQNYRHGVGLNKPMYGGGYVAGGYRIGDGFFEPWFGERETDEGGEFAMELGVPLLKDRRIDKRRQELQRARLARAAVEPVVQTQLLDFVRSASQVYWTWLAAGQIRDAHQELLDLAQQRVKQIEERIEAGDLERNAQIDNQRLIASRETKLISARRKFQMAAIKLSLFFRTPVGRPIVPDTEILPAEFPEHQAPEPAAIEQDISHALAARPELVELDLLAQQTRVDLAQAENLWLPKLDVKVKVSKDVGGLTSPKGDKRPFKLEAGVFGEVPLQRREARGKVRAAQGKLAQIRSKREFVVNKITAQVQDAVSAMDAAAQRIERAEQNLDLARQSLALARESFNAGDIDVILLNIYEQAVTDAKLLLISARADFFIARADYRAALALPPQE